MSKPFTVNVNRFDPFKTFRFLVYIGATTTPAALVSKVTGLKWTAEVIDYREGGNSIIRKGLGRVKYDSITIERGLTFDNTLETWANATQVLKQGVASQSLANLRQEIRIELLDETGLPVHRYLVHRAWISEYQSLPELDAGANAIALEHVKIEHEGWEHDLSLTEQKET